MAEPELTEQAGTPGSPGRLRGADAARLHLTLAGGLVLCVGGFSIELVRALHGHSFSWIYVVEWPFFAGFSLYMWWMLLQGHDRRPRVPGGALPAPGRAPDADLAAWNRYLLELEDAEDAEDAGADQEDPGRRR